jgi:YVTN family beta-propeller protein
MFQSRFVVVAAVAVLAASCSGSPAASVPVGIASSAPAATVVTPPSTSGAVAVGPVGSGPSPTSVPVATDRPVPTAPPTPSPSHAPSGPTTPGGVYWATLTGAIDPRWASMPERVYVPDEVSGDVAVIDPATFKIIGRFNVGAYPEHITPGWDGQTLFVNNMNSGSLTEIDPRTARPNGVTIRVPNPYNLYFTPDGSRAIIVEDMLHGAPTDPNGLLFLDRKTWRRVGFVPIPWAGANHLDFSADGKILFLSTEYGGRIVAVDVVHMKVITSLNVGGSPTDVRLSPDGSVMFVANQLRNGIDVIDTRTLTYRKFIRAGAGAHGLAISRDTKRLFVTNRHAGSISVINIATLSVVTTWQIGGTPDMVAQSPDGSQLWISNRYSGTITVVNSRSGAVIKTIATGMNPHGLSYWPQPGRYSLGHNGNMR